MQTIATLKSDLVRKLHGTSLSKVEGINDLISEAARNVLTRLDPHETVREANIENAIFDDVFTYTSPANLKGDKIIDIQPQVNRVSGQKYTKSLIADFNRTNDLKQFNIVYKNGVKFLRLKDNSAPSKRVLTPIDSITGWSASFAAANITLDSLNFISGNKSLNFDLTTSASVGVIENSTLPEVDLSDTDTQNSAFVWVFLPTANKVTSITGRLGSSSANYYSVTVSTSHEGQVFQDGWNLLRFDIADGTETGTVDWSAISYVQLRFAHDQSGMTDVRVDSITIGVGKLYTVYYYSNTLFQGIDGSLKTRPTLDTDLILLEQDAYNIALYETAYLVAQELQGENGSFDESYFRRKLDGDNTQVGLYRKYTMSYPSQQIKARSQYYKMPGRNY
jgi:hypothetical protein